MNRVLRIITAVIVLSFVLSLGQPAGNALARPPAEQDGGGVIASVWADTPPVIDGVVSGGEWAGAYPLTLLTADPAKTTYLYIKNDAHNLYLLLDVPADTHADDSDYSWFSFDVNDNQAIDAERDLNYGASPISLCLQNYKSASSWSFCRTPNSTLMAGFGRTGLTGDTANHRFWEAAIQLSEIQRAPGQRVGLGVLVGSSSPSISEAFPVGFSDSFSNLNQIRLAMRVAYVYKDDINTKLDFLSFLNSYKTEMTYVQVNDVPGFDFSSYQAIIVGHDTAISPDWGTQAAIDKIAKSGKRILGLGDGGYYFFGKLGWEIGYGNGAHGGSNTVTPYFTNTLFNSPFVLSGGAPYTLYSAPVDTVSIGMPIGIAPFDVTEVGLSQTTPTYRYSSLMSQRVNNVCHTLWGYNGGPASMTSNGKFLFLNALSEDTCLKKYFYLFNNLPDDGAGFWSALAPDGNVWATTLDAAYSFDLTVFNGILIADNTASGSGWMGTLADAQYLVAAGRPILGIGEGGAKMFQLLTASKGLYLNWGHTALNPNYPAQISVPNGSHRVYETPIPVLHTDQLAKLYTANVPSLLLHLPSPVKGVKTIAQDTVTPLYYPVTAQSAQGVCYTLWGPTTSTNLSPAGKALFSNLANGSACNVEVYLPLSLK